MILALAFLALLAGITLYVEIDYYRMRNAYRKPLIDKLDRAMNQE